MKVNISRTTGRFSRTDDNFVHCLASAKYPKSLLLSEFILETSVLLKPFVTKHICYQINLNDYFRNLLKDHFEQRRYWRHFIMNSLTKQSPKKLLLTGEIAFEWHIELLSILEINNHLNVLSKYKTL